MKHFPYVITISSEKGGVGKTTLATNLAIYLKAMRNTLPVTIFSFDNHFTIDRMFEQKGQNVTASVHDFLQGRPFSETVHAGQYGINYLPSSADLSDVFDSFRAPMTLTRLLTESNQEGVIIIDTRPDLNILTQNALFAADRVLIPVKDMPSLENCKNIFSLFEHRGIDRKSLSLIPCLIDSRIKFEGMFRDQKTLLRAFAINRGYRCMNIYISKSPKVESLNTNPDGRIYPILTHARQTEVHNQFSILSRDVLLGMDDTTDTRAELYASWLNEKETKRREGFLARMEGLARHCLICGEAFSEAGEQRGFYCESSDRSARGFLHNDCVTDMLCSALYNITSDSPTYAAARQVVAEKAGRTISSFLPRSTQQGISLDFRQFSPEGAPIFSRELPLPDTVSDSQGSATGRLQRLISDTLSGYEGRPRDGAWLAIHPVDPGNPDSVLHSERYRTLQQLQLSIGDHIFRPAS